MVCYGTVKGRVFRNEQPRYQHAQVEMKQCNVCGLVKPVTEFYKYRNPNGKTGYKGKCKTCHNEYYMLQYERRQHG